MPLIEICILARLDLLGYDTVDVGEYPSRIFALRGHLSPFAGTVYTNFHGGTILPLC